MQNNNLLSTYNLTIGYQFKKGRNILAENINLNLQKGKLITLVGANGIGKSTLLKTLSGIQKPLEGIVLLNEKNITTYTTNQLAQNLSLVLTEKLPPSNLSVYEIIALGRQPYTNWIGKLKQEDKNKIDYAIQLTSIAHFQDKKHYEISDGQLQKVMVARALVQDTPFIILDEPTTHLDLLHKASLFKLLKKLTDEAQKCILFSTHDIELAIQLSDEMIVLLPNKIIQDTPTNLIKNGVFNLLFKDSNILFDPKKGSFVYHSE